MNVATIKSLLKLITLCGIDDYSEENRENRMLIKLLKDPDCGNLDFENEEELEFCVNYLMDECLTLDTWLNAFNVIDSFIHETWSNCWVYQCIKPNINKSTENRNFDTPIETEYLNYLLDTKSVIQLKTSPNLIGDVLRCRNYEGFEDFEKFDICHYFKFLNDSGLQLSQSQFIKSWIESGWFWGVCHGSDRPETYTRCHVLTDLFWVLCDVIVMSRLR